MDIRQIDENSKGIVELNLPDIFRKLADTRSIVRSTLTTTKEELVELIAKGALGCSPCPSEATISALRFKAEVI